MPRLFFLLLLLPVLASAQTSGQYELRKRNVNGTYTSYGVTLSNGQVIGQTAGVPAAITPLVSGDLTPYLTSATAATTYAPIAHTQAWSTITSTPTTLAGYGIADAITAATAASTYQPIATILTTLANLSNGAGVLTNDGSGVFSYVASVTGGATTDAGKIAVFDGLGGLRAANDINVYGSQHSDSLMARLFSDATSGGLQLTRSGGAYAVTFRPGSLTANRTLTAPNATGTIALTSDITGTNSGTNTGDQTITLTGDVTGSGTGSFAATLANTAVTAGSYTSANITIDSKGRITAAANGASGLTIGTTTITSGTSGRLLYNNAGVVGELALGTGVSTALGNATDATSGLLTYGIIGTSGAKVPLLNAANTFSALQTINGAANTQATLISGTITGGSQTRSLLKIADDWTGATGGTSAPTLIEATITDTGGSLNYGATSFLNFKRNGSSALRIDHGGTFYGSGNSWYIDTNGQKVQLGSAWGYSIVGDVWWYRDAAGVWAQRNSTSAQALRVANTYTSSTSNEYFVIDWQTTANTARVGTVKGSGGGTARQMIIQTDGTERIRISASGEIFMTLPTSAGSSGSLWNDSGTVKVAP